MSYSAVVGCYLADLTNHVGCRILACCVLIAEHNRKEKSHLLSVTHQACF